MENIVYWIHNLVLFLETDIEEHKLLGIFSSVVTTGHINSICCNLNNIDIESLDYKNLFCLQEILNRFDKCLAYLDKKVGE